MYNLELSLYKKASKTNKNKYANHSAEILQDGKFHEISLVVFQACIQKTF